MTREQMLALQIAKLELEKWAVLYSVKSVEKYDTRDAEQRLLTAAKQFTRTVDQIDPKLWEPCECCPDVLAKQP